MAALVRSKDWASTPLGPVQGWPQSLRTTVSLCLASNFPINIIWGPQNTQIYNDGYRIICGDAHPHALGEGYDVTWASAWPAIGDPFARAWSGEASFLENQRMFLTRNGYLEETFFTFSLSPIRDESGGIGGVFHPVTETTATILAERRTRALRDLTIRLASANDTDELAAATIDTLAMFDFDLPVLLWYELSTEDGAYRLKCHHGLSPGSTASPGALARGATMPRPMADAARHRRTVEVGDVAALLGDAPCGPYEEAPHRALLLPIQGTGNDPCPVLLVAGVSPRLPFDDVYRGFFDLLVSTITAALASVRAREDERRRTEALADIDRAKTQFFSNVSHEFRTPLTLMLGPLEEALADGNRTAADRERLEIAHRNGQRLLRLVNALLDFSRIEAGRTDAAFEPTDLASVTADLASNFRSATERAGLALVIDIEPLPQLVHVDRDMWEKVVLNLLSNAFKFTFEGEIRIIVKPARDGLAAEVAVSDTGTGISAEALPHLFDRFYRVEGAQGRSFEGSGIGLALVRELVTIHGGDIQVESEPGRGSTFTIVLPIGTGHFSPDRLRAVEGRAQPATRTQAFVDEALQWLPDDGTGPAPDRTDPAGLSMGAGRVLLAEDNKDMRRYVQRLLAAEGFAVEACVDGESALAAARAAPPDLILSDVMMPKLDGFGLLAAVRADPALKNLPYILLSARAGEEARVEGIASGADDYLTKPFAARELVTRVTVALRLARDRRETALRALNVDFERQIVERTRAEAGLERAVALAAAQNRVLELAMQDTPIGAALEAIARTVEAMSSSGALASILLLDKDGTHLRHGAAPSLAAEYNDAIDGIAIGETVGSCGTAAHTRTSVYVSDIATSPLWAEFRELALSNGLRACWSVPILSNQDTVLGTFAIYHRAPREPTAADLELVEFVVRSAALVIERRRAVDALRASETRLRLAVEAGQIGEWELDVVTDTSIRALRHDQIFGHDTLLDEWGFETFLGHVIPDDRAGVEAAFRAAAETGTGWNFECRIQRPNDGALRWIYARSAPQRDGEGRTVRLFGFVQDVTEQRSAEDRLRALNATLETQVVERTSELARIWTLIPDLLMTGSLDGRLLTVNPAWTTVLGFDEATLLSRPFQELIHPDFVDVSAAAVAQMRQGRPARHENRVRTAQGDFRWFDWVSTPVGDVFYAVARDITAVKTRQLELEQTQEALRQSQKMEAVGQLTGGLAHDFNNLLAGISGALELMQIRMQQGRVNDVERYMAAAQGAAKRAAGLTHRLLAFSRRQTLDPRPADVNRLVNGMQELIQRAVGPSIAFEFVGLSGLWPALVDASQLENALLNLCINARDAMPDGGRITVETANRWFDERAARQQDVPEGQYLSVCVTDTGTGMPPDIIEKVFEPFFTTKPLGEGTGLGLSMIYGFAKQSGGQVRIYSEVGKGTTVCIYLPRHYGEIAEEQDRPERALLPAAAQGENVLVVDDEPTVRMLITDILGDLGYNAIEAGDSIAGLKVLLSDVRIDLLVTDVGLPGGMNGRQMADAARERRPNLPVLFITGYAENAVVGNGHLAPGMAILTKPFAVDAMTARLRSIIEALRKT